MASKRLQVEANRVLMMNDTQLVCARCDSCEGTFYAPASEILRQSESVGGGTVCPACYGQAKEVATEMADIVKTETPASWYIQVLDWIEHKLTRNHARGNHT